MHAEFQPPENGQNTDVTESKRRGRWFRFTALIAGLATGLLLAVALLTLRAKLFPSTQWIYLYESGHQKTGHKYIYDSQLGWRNIPNWNSTTFDQPLSINSRGLRDREYSLLKPADTIRILVLGDSYTWGYGVGNKQVYTEVMEDELLKGTSCQVINCGVSGWGTDQQYLFLKNEGFAYQPDIVVLSFFFGNDFREISSSQSYELDKPVFRDTSLSLANVPVPKPKKRGSHPVYYSQADPQELALAIFARMSRDCHQRGVKLAVFKFGTYLDPPTVASLPSLPLQRQQDIANQTHASDVFKRAMREVPNLAYLDMDDLFAAQALTFEQLGVVRSRDMHWNAFGHRQVAMNLFSFLQRVGYLPANADGAGPPVVSQP
jgi:hypothetical protein